MVEPVTIFDGYYFQPTVWSYFCQTSLDSNDRRFSSLAAQVLKQTAAGLTAAGIFIPPFVEPATDENCAPNLLSQL